MKVIIAPDKFKGSLSSFEACRAIREGLEKTGKEPVIIEMPMADGGDGFASVMKHYLTTRSVSCETIDPLGRSITASYEWNGAKKTAIIEMASASGFVLLQSSERDPMITSSIGTGIMIRDAISKGASEIILGLGGSATNDGGTGILYALGFKLIDEAGNELPPLGRELRKIEKIVPPSSLTPVSFRVASDVQNLLYGEHGAAYIYAPQKGAGPSQVKKLDEGLRNLAAVIKRQTGREVSTVSGSGAAGGIAAGLLAFYDTTIVRGIGLVTDAARLEQHLAGTGLLITGEGKIDDQSFSGKVVGTIVEKAKQHGIPCVAFCGHSALNKNETEETGLKEIISLQSASLSEEESMKHAYRLLAESAAGFWERFR